MIAPNASSGSGAALHRAFGLRANHGVLLTRAAERGLLARPLTDKGQPDPAAQTVLLPLVPAHMLEYGAGLLRHIWRTRGTSALWWLYVHPRQSRWWAYCPPQLCGRREIDVDPTFKGCDTPDPDPDLWLAGSLRSVPPGVDVTDLTTFASLLPAHQGVHFVLDLKQPLTSLHAFIRLANEVQAMPAADLVEDPLDQSLAYLSSRLMFRASTQG